MNKIRAGFDINETMDDSIRLLLQYYNKKYDDDLRFEDITDYNIYKFLKPECTNIFKEFINEDFISNLKIRAGAKELVNWCYNQGMTIRFVTAAYEEHFNLFCQFLKNHFSWIQKEHLVRLDDKQEYNLSFLVDDYHENLIGAKYKKYLLRKPWNAEIGDSEYGVNVFGGFNYIKEQIIKDFNIDNIGGV